MFPFKKAMATLKQNTMAEGVLSDVLTNAKSSRVREAMVKSLEQECNNLEGEPSLDEDELVLRSIKKSKGAEIEDASMDDPMQEKEPEGDSSPPLKMPLNYKSAVLGNGRKGVTYKDKVLLLNGEGNVPEEEEEESWMDIQRREEEEDDPVEEILVEAEANPLCPKYRCTKADLKEDCRKWKSAIIIKLLGKHINSKFLLTRLSKMWGITGTLESTFMDNGYILINFTNQNDYNHVQEDGPWVVADHSVVV